MNKRILALAGAAALTASMTACSSSPPSAASVVSSDGYTKAIAQSQLPAIPAKYQDEISSMAAGIKSGGGYELVVVLTSAGAPKVTAADLESLTSSGQTGTKSGDILRLRGSVSNG
jgi:hypothetical protein